MTAMKRNIFYRPMTKDSRDLLLAGQCNTDGKTLVYNVETEPQAQHLGYFTGEMVAIGAKIFENEADLQIAKELVEGCPWVYEIMPLGIMPEIIHAMPCERGINVYRTRKSGIRP
jgi:mannosyl-oligosaccharide alpha-1,2-mannosidase